MTSDHILDVIFGRVVSLLEDRAHVRSGGCGKFTEVVALV
jgi:hypothetical protein